MSGAEAALEAAILETLAADAGVTALLGEPLRVVDAGAPRPAFPCLERVRHQSEPAGVTGVEASEHRVDLCVLSRDADGAQAREAMAAVRAALAGELAEMEGWRCVLLLPVFTDVVRQRSGVWQALIRVKAIVEAA